MRHIIFPNRNWFIERIGKTIQRHRTKCKCVECKENRTKKVVVENEEHAIALHKECINKNILYFDV
jgi:hypothetical protein